MTPEKAIELKSFIDEHITDINKFVSSKLGIDVFFIPKIKNSYNTSLVVLENNDNTANFMMTSTNLLRHMFKEFSIFIYTGYCDESKDVFCNVKCQYTHPGGGSNGLPLLYFILKENGSFVEEM